VVDVTLDNSYPTNGEAITAVNLLGTGATGVYTVSVVTPCVSGYIFSFDHTNMKLKAFYGDYDPAAVGPLVEYANTGAALDALVVRLDVVGY